VPHSVAAFDVESPDTSEHVSFRDRRHAGLQLARRLGAYRERPATLVLGLPRGGVVPAFEIATALHLPLDVIISRKLGAPGNPEFAIGAIAEDGEAYLSPDGISLTRAGRRYIDEEVARQRAEIDRRRSWFRGGKPLALPERATVILVDDGVATGATVIAAIGALRRLKAGRIVLAIPVAPPDTVEVLRPLVEELVVLATPLMFWAVGAFYDDFRQVSDEEVADLLARGAETGGPTQPGPAGTKPEPNRKETENRKPKTGNRK
jgi:putative phosphoribosyl transferase